MNDPKETRDNELKQGTSEGGSGPPRSWSTENGEDGKMGEEMHYI